MKGVWPRLLDAAQSLAQPSLHEGVRVGPGGVDLALLRVVLRVPFQSPSAVEPLAAVGPQAHVALATAVGCGPAGRASLRGDGLRLCGGAPLGGRRARQRHGRSAPRCRPARRCPQNRGPWFACGERRRPRRLLLRQGGSRRRRKERRHMHMMQWLRLLHRRRQRLQLQLRQLRCHRVRWLRLQLRWRCIRPLLALPLAPSHPPPPHASKRSKAQKRLSDFGTGGPQRHMPRQGPARRRHSFGSA